MSSWNDGWGWVGWILAAGLAVGIVALVAWGAVDLWRHARDERRA